MCIRDSCSCLRFTFRRYVQEFFQASNGDGERRFPPTCGPAGLCSWGMGLYIPCSSRMVCEQFHPLDNDNSPFNIASAPPDDKHNRILCLSLIHISEPTRPY